ncbi:hypothetical protein [Taibaiella koreensis]|uniref:hypothetical protein n=1 Tax=Taibaiella koreensis TaxID=1268548 RepID=UPI0013C3011F|nr:hypothetical protein [Taibaiella koreensis]
MDHHDSSFEPGCYRLRTARQRKRSLKEDRDKQLIRLQNRQEELLMARRRLPLTPLEEPYQRGWKRTFILREDVARSAAAAFYSNLLSKINTIDYAVNRSFKRRVKRKRNRKKLYEVKPQHLRAFYSYEWSRAQLSPEEKVLFYPKEYVDKGGKPYIQYVFAEPWRFVLQVRPNMITHVKTVDEVLEQELEQIDNHITQHHLGPRLNRIVWGCGWRSRWDRRTDREKNPLHNKPLYRITAEAANDEEHEPFS